MAEIVLGIGASHGPLLSTPPEKWDLRAKADRVVVTATDDPGPDEKGHTPVQVGGDYRVEMPVPEGFYAVWVVPANGARARRVADRVRVLPGRTTRVGE